MRSHLLLALLFALASLCTSFTAEAQSSRPPSPATEPASRPTTSIDSAASTILLPLADKVVSSSQSTDELSASMQQQIADDETQRTLEAQQRQKEREASATELAGLSSRAATLQSWQSDFVTQLGVFRGSEQEKHEAAVAALAKIQGEAKAMRVENTLLKWGTGTLLLAGGVYFAGHAAGAW